MVKYTFHYLNGRGRAEISRLIFAAAGIEYKNNIIEDWPKPKLETPIGQVPYLEIDETKLPQSLTIARYLAREYNLVGKNNLEAAKCDAIVDTCIDLMTAFYNKVFIVIEPSAKDQRKNSNQSLNNFLNEDALKGLDSIEKLINAYSVDGYSVGCQLTWADLFIHEITTSLINYKPNILDKYSKIKQIRELVEKNESISNYLKKRPQTPF